MTMTPIKMAIDCSCDLGAWNRGLSSSFNRGGFGEAQSDRCGEVPSLRESDARQLVARVAYTLTRSAGQPKTRQVAATCRSAAGTYYA
jgi:hypothetical protein